MKNDPKLEVREENGVLVHQGVIRVPYTWAAGKPASKFYAGLREGKIYGIRCSECQFVFVPPKKTCHRCFSELSDWVEVKDTGTLETFTVVRYFEPGLHPMKPPFAYGIIKLDGADTGMVHIIRTKDYGSLKEGARVKAVFRKKPRANYLDISHFRPTTEARHG